MGVLALATGLLVLGAPPAAAATITVNTTVDELNADGDCSLREALEAANTDTAVDGCAAGSGADVIVVPAGTYVVDGALGALEVDSDVTIQGAGQGSTVINGAAVGDTVRLGAGLTVVIEDLSIVDAGSDGIEQSSGTIDFTLRRVTVTGSGNEGVELEDGSFTVIDSTLDDNDGDGLQVEDGTIEVSGSSFSGNGSDGIDPDDVTATFDASTVNANGDDGFGSRRSFGSVTFTRSTISGNGGTGVVTGGTPITVEASTVADNGEDGLTITDEDGDQGAITVTNSTVTGNALTGVRGGIGGVVLVHATVLDSGQNGVNTFYTESDSGPISLTNSVIAGHGDTDCVSNGTTSAGGNIDSDDSCGLTAEGDQPSVADPMIGALADNGGPTQTRLPQDGSPAIDAALAARCEAVDQRGFVRPVDGDDDGVVGCDVGAVEVGALAPVGPTPPTPPAGPAPAPGAQPVGGQPSFTG